MKTEYNNKTVYEFLIQECQTQPALREKFETGLIAHTDDTNFWIELSEHLDCFRICDECGKPMIEGYVVDGCETYCSEECLYRHVSKEDFNQMCDNGNSNSYWTTWYEESNTYNQHL